VTDSVIKSEFTYSAHEDKLTHKQTQPTEGIILRRNAELRKNEGVIRDLGHESGDSWGRQVASIPEIMFHAAIRDGYDLMAKDAKHAAKEMHRFLGSEKGKQCLIREKI